MEGRIGRLPTGECESLSYAAASRLRGVNRGVVPRRTRSVQYLRRPVLHEVGFAARRPGHGADVAAQAPECRPQALVCGIGQLNTGLENTEREILFVFGIHAARYPRSIDVYGLNHKVPAAIDVNRRR